MLKEVFKGGGGGGDAKNTMSFRAADSLDPGVADAHAVEGSVDPGCDVLGFVWLELEPCVMGELKGAIVHGRHKGSGGPPLVWLSLGHLPSLRGRGGGNRRRTWVGPSVGEGGAWAVQLVLELDR